MSYRCRRSISDFVNDTPITNVINTVSLFLHRRSLLVANMLELVIKLAEMADWVAD